jgi:hypothetical protein
MLDCVPTSHAEPGAPIAPHGDIGVVSSPVVADTGPTLFAAVCAEATFQVHKSVATITINTVEDFIIPLFVTSYKLSRHLQYT